MKSKTFNIYKECSGREYIFSEYFNDWVLVDKVCKEITDGNQVTLDFDNVKYITDIFFFDLFDKLENCEVTFDNMSLQLYDTVRNMILHIYKDEYKIIKDSRFKATIIGRNVEQKPTNSSIINVDAEYGYDYLLGCDDHLLGIIHDNINKGNQVILNFSNIKLISEDFFFDILPLDNAVVVFEEMNKSTFDEFTEALELGYDNDEGKTQMIFQSKMKVFIAKSK